MTYLCYNTYNGPAAVSFQFSRIGNDPGAARLFEDLNQDSDLGKYIDMLPIEFDFESQLEDKWFVVCHNLLFSKPIELQQKPN